MSQEFMMQAAADVAYNINARAIVSFIQPFDFKSEIPVIWVQGLQLDVLKDLTMQDILEVTESHLLDAAVQIYLSRTLEEGKIIGVFPYALIIYDIKEGKDFISVREFEDIVPRDVMYSVLTLAMEIAIEGREGRSIGTAFIIGDENAIMELSHQAILNPYLGQPPEECDVTNRDTWESVKEFAQLDGVFVIGKGGHIKAAGRYIDADTSSIRLPGGLGGRQMAAAAITKEIPVIGVTVSESGGMLRVFRDGEIRLSIRSDVRMQG